MQSLTVVVFAALLAVVLAEGQFYVPRAYYTIDDDGHASAPIPLRRLRRSLNPQPFPYAGYYPGSNSNAEANANAWSSGGNSHADANANAYSGAGGWGRPIGGGYGASNPNVLRAGETRRLSGPVSAPGVGRSVSTGSSISIDSAGQGYYDTYSSVSPASGY